MMKTMMLILPVWVLLLAVFSGLGLLIRRSFGLRANGAGNIISSFWTGWAAAVFFLQICQLFFPAGWHALIPLSLAGTAGLISSGKELRHLFRNGFAKNRVPFFLLLVTMLWLADRAILAPANYDSGLYHLNAVRWNATYPVVPGLGNLYGRLAYNSSYFLYPAMLHTETGPWAGTSHNLANGPLLIAMLAQLYLSGFRLLKKNSRLRNYDLFNSLLLVPVLRQAMGPNLSSPSPDLPVFLLGIIVLARLLALLEDRESVTGEREYGLVFIATLTALGIIIKLNFFALGMTALLLAFITGTVRKDFRFARTAARAIPVLAIGIIPWMIRGVILSGYPAYPNAFLPFPVEWRIPRASVVNMANWIRSWARQPGVHWSRVLNSRDWLIPCAMRILFFALPPLLFALPSVFLLVFHGLSGKRFREPPCRLWLFLVPVVVSITFVFLTVPDPRFAGSDYWTLAMGMVALSANRINALGKKMKHAVIVFMAIMLLQEIFVDGKGDFAVDFMENRNLAGAFRHLHPVKSWIVKPGDNNGFYPVPRVELMTFRTDSGLILYGPERGDRFWDPPLPATLYPHAGLRLRNPENLRQGFIIEPRDENDPSVGMHTDYQELPRLPAPGS